MSSNSLYTDLSDYYDLLCAEIDYPGQSQAILRLNDIFGNGGRTHLDLGCGTGPHIPHFVQAGFECQGLDLNPPMLRQAKARCPEATFLCADMCDFSLAKPVDLITCFLYSIHYCGTHNKLVRCFQQVHQALAGNGLFCFNAVDKTKIDSNLAVSHSLTHQQSHFEFRSGWHYDGQGEHQYLTLKIRKKTGETTEDWEDRHTMVAVSFDELTTLLSPFFEVQIFEHDYERIIPWDQHSGNAIFLCTKKVLQDLVG